jgi:hypothetical protein
MLGVEDQVGQRVRVPLPGHDRERDLHADGTLAHGICKNLR